MRVVILSAHNLRQKTEKFARTMHELRQDMQVLAVNVLYHASKHGDPDMLNMFYGHLSKGDQASFKRWVVAEISKVYPDNTKLSDMFISFAKEKWSIKKGHTETRSAFTTLVDGILSDAAMSEEYGKFFGIDPDKVKDPFNTTTLLARLNGLVKSAEREDAVVDPTALNVLKEMVAGFTIRTKDIIAAEAARVAHAAAGTSSEVHHSVH